jgi:hypothetical protein
MVVRPLCRHRNLWWCHKSRTLHLLVQYGFKHLSRTYLEQQTLSGHLSSLDHSIPQPGLHGDLRSQSATQISAAHDSGP